MGVLHLIQAIAVYLSSDPYKGIVPITLNYLKFDRIISKLLPTTEQISEVNLAWFVVIFFLLSSLAHFFIATVYKEKYESVLKNGINKVRCFE